MSINIKEIPWSSPRPHAGKYFRTAPVPLGFLEEWKLDKKFLKSKGFSLVKKKDGTSELCLWTDHENLPGDAPVIVNDELPPLPPIETTLGEVSLLPPQIPHVQNHVRSLRLGNCAIDASDTGVGKTLCAILTAHNLGLQPVVLCPKAVIASWRGWAQKAGIRLDVTNYDQAIRGNFGFVERTKRKRPAYMQFEWKLRNPDRYLLIFDEGHKLKGEETLTACLLGAAKRSGAKCLILSATLAESPLDMKNIGYAMGLHHWSNWHDFLSSNGCFCNLIKKTIERRRKNGSKYEIEVEEKKWTYIAGKTGMERLHSYIFPRMGARLTVEDMDGFFPDNHIIPHQVDIGGVEKVYQLMREELRELEAKRKRDEYASDSKLTILLRAQQEAELLKVPTFIEMARDLEAEGRSVAIFAQFRETLDAIQKALGACALNGDVDEVAKFQADKSHFICVQIQAGGAGVSLHQEKADMRPRASLIMPVFDARMIKQALGRIHRANAKDKTTQYIVFDAQSKTDVRVCRAIENKLGNIDAFNGSLDELAILEC